VSGETGRSKNRLASFLHAANGWRVLITTTPNARIHVAFILGITALGFWLGLTFIEWAVIWLAIGLVVTAEFLNSAIESVVDLASPEFHALAKSAKDVAAGGVLFAAFCAVIIGLLILGPPLFARLSPFLLH
jgi:diacylglycerol kinase